MNGVDIQSLQDSGHSDAADEILALRKEIRTLRFFIRAIENSVNLAINSSAAYKLPEDR